ncbi:E3 ubiquitin-protein ligase RNF168 [Sorex araneus]|uniref:E3 ubiquitin-protein ligase RNF168 n=1 Tax=Sorex araneus TaxID=42254 RepID=UPI002433CA59|nr:E3 ubiquitin-protein ligase RNF168 [Sorex araneus]XP_054983931.1 E3 ubiquitin-protein ligase RNF168 [Sorex araneus]
MALSPDAVPSLSDCQCQICVGILIEPVTLPCSHTLCNACFQSTVEKASLCCPFCRRRVSSWTRYHTRRNSLINKELWEVIQKHYPEECKLRASGLESEEFVDDCCPVRLISKPGELRREYEEEISKVAAERRASEEEEKKASEEYIQRLLAEEEEEERRQAEKRQKEQEEQLKNDEELARKLSTNLNNFHQGNVMTSPMNSKKSGTVTAKSQKKSKNKQTSIGDIQKYLLPRFVSASQPELVQEIKSNSKSAEELADHGIKSPTWQNSNTVGGEQTPSQVCLEVQEQSAKSPVDSPVPQLCASNTDECLEGEAKTGPESNHEAELCAPNHEGPEVTALYSRENAATPCGQKESECAMADMSGITDSAETDSEESCLSISKDTSKRRNQESSLEMVKDPCLSVKRRKILADPKETDTNFTQRLMDLEHLFFERHKQEEQDRLFALQLQKEVDKEQMKPNRQKGSPDGYQLRALSSPQEDQNGQRKTSRDRNFKKKADKEHSEPQRSSKNENRHPSLRLKHSVKGKKMSNSTGDNCNLVKSTHSLELSKSQQSIFQMFKRYTN